MGTRITARGLAQAALVARTADPDVVVSFDANALPGDKRLRFYGVVKIGGTSYDLAGNNGRLKLFGDVDGYVKYVAAAMPAGGGSYSVKVNTGVTLAAAIPADLVKAAAAKVAKLQAAKVSQQAVVAGLDAQLAMMAGWESGSPLQVARFVEVMEQKAAVLADVAAIDAEIVRLTP